MDDTGLRNHQGQAAVGDELGGQGLGQVPDLGEFQLEGGGGGDQPQPAQLLHGLAVVGPQAVVPPDLEAQLRGPADGSPGAAQGLGHPQLPQGDQIPLQLGEFPVRADPGEDGGHRDTRLLAVADGVGIGGPLAGGEVEQGRFQP